MDRVRVRAGVREVHAQEVVLGGPDDRARNRAVVRPGREEDAGRDLELAVDGAQLVLADATRLVGQRLRRQEQPVEVVRPADGGHLRADHRRVAVGAVLLVGREVPRVVVSSDASASPYASFTSAGVAASGAAVAS